MLEKEELKQWMRPDYYRRLQEKKRRAKDELARLAEGHEQMVNELIYQQSVWFRPTERIRTERRRREDGGMLKILQRAELCWQEEYARLEDEYRACLDKEEQYLRLREELEGLPMEERAVLLGLYGRDLTWDELERGTGLSHARLGQLRRQAVERVLDRVNRERQTEVVGLEVGDEEICTAHTLQRRTELPPKLDPIWAAAAQELAWRDISCGEIALAVGLPYPDYRVWKGRCAEGLPREHRLEFDWKERSYRIALRRIWLYPVGLPLLLEKDSGKGRGVFVRMGRRRIDTLAVEDGKILEEGSIQFPWGLDDCRRLMGEREDELAAVLLRRAVESHLRRQGIVLEGCRMLWAWQEEGKIEEWTEGSEEAGLIRDIHADVRCAEQFARQSWDDGVKEDKEEKNGEEGSL